MILVAGGTGHLGIELVPLLTARGIPVRVVTRDPDRARQRLGETPQLAKGDARNPHTLEAALKGVDAVVSAMTGFGPGAPGPKAVDYEGNLNLIRAAEAAGVRRFVLVSIHGATAGHARELWQMKYRAEEALPASQLDRVIVRSNAYVVRRTVWRRRPLKRDGAAMTQGGLAFDTVVRTFDAGDRRGRVPQLDRARMADVLARHGGATTTPTTAELAH